MIEGIIFDWIGTLYERNKGPFPFSEKVLREFQDPCFEMKSWLRPFYLTVHGTGFFILSES